MTRKTIGLRCLGFFAGLLICLLAASYIVAPKGNGEHSGFLYRDAKGIIAEKPNTVDVVFLGDSEVYASISPMQLWEEQGLTSYDCSTGGQLLFDTMSLLHTALENQQPKLVVLEVNATFREFSLGEVAYNKVGEYLAVFTYHDRWKWMKLSEFFGPKDFTWTSEMKGFRLNMDIQPTKKKDHMKESDESKNMPKKNEWYVEAIRKICEEKNIAFMLLSTPSSRNWNMKKHNTISALAEAWNVPYVDMNLMEKELDIRWDTDTKDKEDHLNYYGARKVTSYLGKYLKETYGLPDHRGDTEYENWDNCLKKYHEQVDLLVSRMK